MLTSAIAARRHTTIIGSLASAPNTTFTVELFANTTPNPSGYGEGERYLGSTTVTTDFDGTVSFTFRVHMPINPGDWISATATDAAGNTSAFSQCAEVTTLSPGTDRRGADLLSAVSTSEASVGSIPAPQPAPQPSKAPSELFDPQLVDQSFVGIASLPCDASSAASATGLQEAFSPRENEDPEATQWIPGAVC